MDDDTRSLAEKQTDNHEPISSGPQPVVARPVEKQPSHRHAFSFVTILLLLALLGAGVLAYFWFDTKQDLEGKQREFLLAEDTINQLRTNISKLKSEEVVGGDFIPQSAINAVAISYVQAYRTAQSLQTQPYNVKIMYMTEKYARVEVVSIDKNDKAKETGIEAVLFLKNIPREGQDQNWVIIGSGESMADIDKTELKTTFGVPDEVITATRQE